MPNTRKVLLLIESARGFGRDMLTGISQYALCHGPWSFYTYPPFFRSIEKNREILRRIKHEGIDGVILRDLSDIQEIVKLNIPAIFASSIKPKTVTVPERFPVIRSDNRLIGEMAAEHLINCGFKNFAYCGYENIGWSQERFFSFNKFLNEKSLNVNRYSPPKTEKMRHWERERQVLSDWLCSLPKPIGVMSCSDDRCKDLIEAAKIASIRIPEDVAVVGVDNDKLVCELANPTLSSIALDTISSGYKAAELLDNLMSGRDILQSQKILIKPTYVEVRHSTDIMVIEDDEVLNAMHFIRNNLRQLITVDDVVDGTYLSRRSLERRFIQTLGRSIHNEIYRIKIECISKMLIETNMAQLQIAHLNGFNSLDNLRRFFHRRVGLTPLEYRKQHC